MMQLSKNIQLKRGCRRGSEQHPLKCSVLTDGCNVMQNEYIKLLLNIFKFSAMNTQRVSLSEAPLKKGENTVPERFSFRRSLIFFFYFFYWDRNGSVLKQSFFSPQKQVSCGQLTAKGSACSQEMGAPHEAGLIFSGKDSGTATRMKQMSSREMTVARITTRVSP